MRGLFGHPTNLPVEKFCKSDWQCDKFSGFRHFGAFTWHQSWRGNDAFPSWHAGPTCHHSFFSFLFFFSFSAALCRQICQLGQTQGCPRNELTGSILTHSSEGSGRSVGRSCDIAMAFLLQDPFCMEWYPLMWYSSSLANPSPSSQVFFISNCRWKLPGREPGRKDNHSSWSGCPSTSWSMSQTMQVSRRENLPREWTAHWSLVLTALLEILSPLQCFFCFI